MFSAAPWIGLNDREFTGRYRWIATNESLGWSRWKNGEPDFGGDRCVRARAWRNSLGWEDKSCYTNDLTSTHSNRPMCEQIL